MTDGLAVSRPLAIYGAGLIWSAALALFSAVVAAIRATESERKTK